jgi:phosphosulfolactate synthase
VANGYRTGVPGAAHGLTMIIDSGMPLVAFDDLIDSHGQLIDLVKFGWGTALVTRDISTKVARCRAAGIGCYFGGTLFEHAVWTGQIDAYLDLAKDIGVTHLEVSNGTIPLSHAQKAEYVFQLAAHHQVIAEVGFKDQARSESLSAQDWADAVALDMSAGAALVTLETRESGRCGIARSDGSMRRDVLDALLQQVDPTALLFEAPTKALQCELIEAVGPSVNLGNVAHADVVGVETLRLGLRSDTLLSLHPGGGILHLAGSERPVNAAESAA